MACSSLSFFDVPICPPRTQFKMLDMRGIVSNLETRDNFFSFNIGKYPSKMIFFVNAPNWLKNGITVKIEVDGQDVTIEQEYQEIISKTPKNP